MDGSGKLGGVNAENKVKIEKVGGIKAIMKGMGRHGEDAGVQQEGCAALWSLGMNAENNLKITEAGGTKTIVEVGAGSNGSRGSWGLLVCPRLLGLVWG
jgi:hypothetical protein